MKRYYSHSKLETFEQCPFKYKLCYIDKVPRPDRESVEAFMGNKVHASLKKLYDELKNGRGLPQAEIIEYYENLWEAGMSEKVFVVKPGNKPDNYKIMGKTFIENYFKKHFPFNEDETLETEHRVSLQIDEPGELIFNGIIDRVSRRNDSTIIIHDYKTSSRLPSQKEIEKDRQLTMYQLAYSQRLKQGQKMELTWHYLAFDTDLKCVRDENTVLSVKNAALGIIKKIESTENFNFVTGALCSWCDYIEHCPAGMQRKVLKESKKYFQQELF